MHEPAPRAFLKPRLLMLTHRFPFPPNRGDRIRAYHLLRFLSENYSVTLAAVTDEPIADEHFGHIDALCDTVLVERLSMGSKLNGATRSILACKSLTEGMLGSNKLSQRVADAHQNDPFDSMVVFCSGMFQYVDQPAFENVRMLVDLVDVDSQKWSQMSREARILLSNVYARESGRVQHLEQKIANRADSITLVSDIESRLFEQTVDVPADTTVQGVGNGVDAEYFSPETSSAGITQPSGSELELVFTGVMNYYPNVAGVHWFCHHVLPRMRQRLNVTFRIVGRSPNRQIRSLTRLDGVEVVGEVPDVRPYVAAADIVVSPLTLARGIQNKVLEAMAMQRPVVCSTPSADGIAGEHGTHFLIADTVDQWISELMRLADDVELRREIAGNARQRVLERYSWPARLSPMLDLLQPSSLEPAYA